MDIIIDEGTKFAAVTIPITNKDGIEYMLLEKRSMGLPDQPGDICLPGGMVEDGETPLEAALRETEEELLVDEKQIKVLGPSPALHSANIVIYPFMVNISNYNGDFDEEVSEILYVPLEFFKNTKPESYPLEWKVQESSDFPYNRIVGGENYKWRKHIIPELFYDFQGTTIWGITAKIIYHAMKEERL